MPTFPEPSGHPPILTLRLRLSNVHLLATARPVLFDTGSPGEEGAILRWISGLGLPPPQTVILTHAHADHAGSAAALRQLTGARLCLAPGDWDMARAGQNRPLRPVRLSAYPLARLLPDRFAPFTPDVALDSPGALADLGLDARLLATPGHTPGSISLLFPSGDAVIGDLAMGGYIGGHLRPRHPRPHYFAEDPGQNAASLALVLAQGARRLHVGHGGTLLAADLTGKAAA